MAAGFSALELGSDIGGSIRVPAHYCGVFGHKPSWGLCSGRGQSLAPAASATDIAVIGPLARSAMDLSLALDVIAGADPLLDTAGVALAPPRAMRLSDLRVAVWSSEPGRENGMPRSPHRSTRRRFPGARRRPRQPHRASRLQRDGRVPSLHQAAHRGAERRASEESAGGRVRKPRRAPTHRRHECRCDIGPRGRMTHREWLHLNERRIRSPPHMGRILSGMGGGRVLCPPIATAALPHMQQGETWERSVTVNGRPMLTTTCCSGRVLPARSTCPPSRAPIGLSEAGLPIGAQIVGHSRRPNHHPRRGVAGTTLARLPCGRPVGHRSQLATLRHRDRTSRQGLARLS